LGLDILIDINAKRAGVTGGIAGMDWAQAVTSTRGMLVFAVASMLLFVTALAGSASSPAARERTTGTITIDESGRPVSRFRPDETFGAALDGKQQGQIDRIYTPENINKMRSAGLRKITYRLRTELGVEAWHWSEQGTWSDAEHSQGYWVSSAAQDQRVLVSHGYRLPRRGNTIDQADDDGYSRLTDGDPTTFWKSNPYLDSRYTHDAQEARPQWVVIDFGKKLGINALKVLWGQPYAKSFEVQYWVSAVSDFGLSEEGEWRRFPHGSISRVAGAPDLLRLSGLPVQTRYIRILLRDSSGTAPSGSTDVRDSLGFAIDELYLGTIDDGGRFQDIVAHAPNNEDQTVTYTSSTDPWHRAVDLDPNTEQPGFDLVFGSGLTNDLPVLMPVGLLYDTPENAAAEIKFLEARGYSIRQVEVGEEPDGQFVSPEHEAALYLEFARAIHNVDPKLALGGPSFQSGIIYTGFDVDPSKPWLTRFLSYLRAHGRLGDYTFLSFEWYPFDDLCSQPASQLIRQPVLLADVFRQFRENGVPSAMPIVISEFGYSSYAGRTLVEMPSALMTADIVGQFLTLGGRAAYLFGYEPSRPFNEKSLCADYGQLMLLEGDTNVRASWPMPTYFATRLITQEWAEPVNRWHKLYAANSDIRDEAGRQIVTAYAVKRPDRKWSVMLVNKDPQRAYDVHISFAGTQSSAGRFRSSIQAFQYSSGQYAWQSAGQDGHPVRTDPPQQFVLSPDQIVHLPPFSLTVLRGKAADRPRVMSSVTHHPREARWQSKAHDHLVCTVSREQPKGAG
jgi:hypothetical protein